MAHSTQITLQQTEAQISRLIIKEIAKKLTIVIKRVSQPILNKAQQLYIEQVKKSPEFRSIISGQLKYELGIPDGDNRLNRILEASSRTIKIKTSPVVASLSGVTAKMTIYGVPTDYADILSLTEASVHTPKTTLSWLKWLLTLGDKIIVRDYFFKLEKTHKSRTGIGVMKAAPGSGWRVPPQFSGTPNNNFITRSIDNVLSELETYVRSEFIRSFK